MYRARLLISFALLAPQILDSAHAQDAADQDSAPLDFVATDSVVQDSATHSALSVFLDCDRCDRDFIRREIPYVNYVRDRQDADVHLLITSQRGGAGREYALYFIGRETFAGVDDTLTVMSSFTDTDDERRKAILHRIELGLIRYLARTPSASWIEITFDSTAATNGLTNVEDKWDFWSFRVATDGNLSAESATNSFRIGGRVSADRVTDAWKIRLAARGNYSENNFDLGDGTRIAQLELFEPLGRNLAHQTQQFPAEQQPAGPAASRSSGRAPRSR